MVNNQHSIWDFEYNKNPSKWKKETKFSGKNIKNKNVLEIGVGNGKTLISILKYKPKNVHAIDFSKNAIAECENKESFKKVKFQICSLTDMPYEDNYFESIFCYYVLNNMLKKERVLAIKEIKRVLKNKGYVYFEDFSINDFRKNEMGNSKYEKNTYEKKNGLISHFFEEKELYHLFRDFKKSKFREKISYPFRNKKNIKRAIIYGEIKN